MKKCDRGTPGKPRFTYGDVVKFSFPTIESDGEEVDFEGTIEIVDSWGTFFNTDEPSYDIMVDDWRGTGERMFVKHVAESNLYEE